MIFTFSFVILYTLVGKFIVAIRHRSQGECRIICCSENYIIVDKEPDLKINSNNKNEVKILLEQFGVLSLMSKTINIRFLYINNFQRTLQTFLKIKCPDVAKKKLFHEYYFPHRLDYPTSGIMCIPKNEKACRAVAKAFSNRDTKKYYIALVRGLFSSDLVDVNMPIGEYKKQTFQALEQLE